jgi:uncharacterized membrane protein
VQHQCTLAQRAAEERKRGLQEKIAELVTRFAGSMLFVYLHLILFGGWIQREWAGYGYYRLSIQRSSS